MTDCLLLCSSPQFHLYHTHSHTCITHTHRHTYTHAYTHTHIHTHSYKMLSTWERIIELLLNYQLTNYLSVKTDTLFKCVISNNQDYHFKTDNNGLSDLKYCSVICSLQITGGTTYYVLCIKMQSLVPCVLKFTILGCLCDCKLCYHVFMYYYNVLCV